MQSSSIMLNKLLSSEFYCRSSRLFSVDLGAAISDIIWCFIYFFVRISITVVSNKSSYRLKRNSTRRYFPLGLVHNINIHKKVDCHLQTLFLNIQCCRIENNKYIFGSYLLLSIPILSKFPIINGSTNSEVY